MTIRRDEETVMGDEQGFMWSWWLFDRFSTLQMKATRTPEEDAEIDIIVEASKNGRKALEEVENKLRALHP